MNPTIKIDSTPFAAPSLPFANEIEVQEFFEKHAKETLGLTVIGSTRPGEGGLFKIDVLAVDDANNPYLIECKWNQVGRGAIQQLLRYRELFLEDPSFFAERLTDRELQVTAKQRAPVLMTVGYWYRNSVLTEAEAESIVCLTYDYHNVTFEACRHVSPPFEAVEPRPSGKVSIEWAHHHQPARHPIACKRHIVVKRLKRLPALQTAFWEIDRSVRALNGVTAIYGKNPDVSYHGPHGKFAEARFQRPESIQWIYCQSGGWKSGERLGDEMRAARDAKRIIEALRKAYAYAV